MLSSQTSRTVSERLDPLAMRRPSWLRRLRWQLGGAALLLALLIPAFAFVSGDKKVFQSGQLSMAHQFIAHDCARCHDTPGQTLWRAVSLRRTGSTISEQACLSCHKAPPHHPAKFSARKCGDCHREHRGPGSLTDVKSGFCTECHADLPEGASFARHISGFNTHPEFAVLAAPGTSPIGPRHELLQRVKKDPSSGQWQDKAAIALNHKAHLNPRGLPTQPSAKQKSIGFEQLDCQSCHVSDVASGNFQAIRFDQHCARCHAEQLAFLGAESGALREVQPLPHHAPEIVRGVLRERLSRAIEAAVEPIPNAEKPLRRFFPGVPDRPALTVSQEEALAQQMHLADGLLFTPRAEGARLGSGCAYCHEVSRKGNDVSIRPPEIPSRWLSHARFRHDAHRQLNCTSCHATAPQSTATTDILLPSIAVCQKCHQDAAAATRSAGVASAECSQCHDYHLHSSLTWDGPHALP